MNPECNEPSSAPRRRRPATAAATLIAVSGIVAFPGLSAGQASHDSATVRGRIAAYQIAWNTHDASSTAAFFADDADLVVDNLPAARGRQAIQDWWRNYFGKQEPERRLSLAVSSVRFLADDVAIVHMVTTTGGYDRNGQGLPERRARETWVVQRQDDVWLVSAMRGMPMEDDRVVLNASRGATEAFRPHIRAFIDAYEDAFNRHDPSAVSRFYRSDADITVRNGPVMRGRQAIENLWTSYFSEPRPYRAVLIPEEIRMMTPDVALINVIGTGAPDQAGTQPAPVRYTRTTWVLVREGGKWLIAALWVLPSEDDQVVRASRH